MKGIKVIDAGSDPEWVEYGTCDLCFSTGVADNPWLELEYPDGQTETVDIYYWDWGDYNEAYVGNIVDFSAWLQEQDVEPKYETLETFELMDLIYEYNSEGKHE